MAPNFRDSDAALLRRARQGDSTAFSQLSRKHEPKIFAVSWRILKNREDAEDNAQATLMNAYLHCGQFRGGSQFSTWLVRVAINEALMRLRRRKSHTEVSLGPDPENDEGFLPDRDVSNAPDQERECIARDLVDKLCACLSPTLRDVFVLYSMEGWSHEELSRVFGVPRRAIKSRIFRARSQLREQWAKYNQC
jgi:RNA polymerase sigma-70 factor (ECF subfamily)